MCNDNEDSEKEQNTEKCSHCGIEINTDDCIECANCGDLVCRDCSVTCQSCENLYCQSCVSECSSCGDYHCSDCLEECSECGAELCGECRFSCANCGDTLCESCTRGCDYCETIHCESCRCNCAEVDFDEFYYNPHLNFDHDAKPGEWEFIKQPWENTTYLGIELEMEFPADKEDKILNITKKYFPRQHFWKLDGSIQEYGGELVITPFTLQSFNCINLKEMFKELQTCDAVSYDATNACCGFHIHTNLDGYSGNDILKLKQFFITNKDFILKFSQRTEETLNEYARIPDDLNYYSWNDRYVALNTTEETLEFRVFRGTLDYFRFKATLEFVDAIILFVKLHSMAACKNINSLFYFKKFIVGRYNILNKYLETKGLV